MSTSYHTENVPAPNLIGKTSADAVRICAEQSATFRLFEEKIDTHLPDGTIVAQDPVPGTPIKPDSPVWCTISKKLSSAAPRLIGLTHEQISQKTEPLGITCTYANIDSTHPVGTCIAQYPLPTHALPDAHMTIYLAHQKAHPVIMPHLANRYLTDVLQFLHEHGCIAEIFFVTPREASHACGACVVIDQHPKAGAILTSEKIKNLHVQLSVRCAA